MGPQGVELWKRPSAGLLVNGKMKHLIIGIGHSDTKMPDSDNQDLEEKRRRLDECTAKFAETCKSRSYRTDEGFVFSMPDFDDPEVMQCFAEWDQAATAYYSAATFLKHATTYRYDPKLRKAIQARQAFELYLREKDHTKPETQT